MHTVSKQVLTTLLIIGACLPTITSAQSGPETFFSLTIGPEASGFASFDCENDQFDVSSSSASIAGGGDAFQFVYRELTNDADVRARIRTNNASLAGLMIRSGSGSNTSFAMVGLSGGQTKTRYRASMNAATTEGNSMGNAFWIRIRREGNVISSFSSSDGTSWVLVESKTLNLGVQVLVGMAVVNGKTAFSDVVVIGTLEQIDVVDPGPTETIPTAPSGLVASVASNSQVNLSWSDNSANETGFRVQRRTGSGTFQLIASPSDGTTSYSDSSVAESTNYTYRILAFNNAGTSSASNSQQVTIPGPAGTVPNAPSGLIATVVSGSQVNLIWIDNSSNETGFRVQRQTGSGAFQQIASPVTGATSYSDSSVAESTSYTYRILAYNNTGTSSASNSQQVSTPSVSNPTPIDPNPPVDPIESVDEIFSVNDIGTAIQSSAASYDTENDMFRLTASGGQIWGTEDDFHYVYREITGDVEATVKVSSLVAGDEFGKAGIMFRESSAEDSRHAFLTVSAGKGVAFERRLKAGGGTTSSGKGNVAAPIWLRLLKEGTYISAYYSEDGDNWSFLSEDIIDFSDTVFIGLAVAANSANDSVTADFGELNIIELNSASATETFVSADIGKVGVNGDAAYDSSTDTFIVQAAGGDIGPKDAFHYVYREVEGDFEAVAKIDSLVAEENWAKAGLMVRDGIRPDAPYFALFMAKNIGIVHQYRTTLDGLVDWSKIDDVYASFWVKVSRQGNLYRASYSLNGTNWTFMDDATMDLPQTLLVGMAVTSHAEGALAFAEFSNISISN